VSSKAVGDWEGLGRDALAGSLGADRFLTRDRVVSFAPHQTALYLCVSSRF
jgi:hypothetical protein